MTKVVLELPADANFAPAGAVRTRPYLHLATRVKINQAVAAGEMTQEEADDLIAWYAEIALRPLPVVARLGSAYIPMIYHGDCKTEWLRWERFRRKAKANPDDAIAYAARVIWYRQRRENEKRRRVEAIDPRITRQQRLPPSKGGLHERSQDPH
jgi:hypothetical protein